MGTPQHRESLGREYARDGSHVNTLEGYFSILKRSIRSTHTLVSRKAHA